MITSELNRIEKTVFVRAPRSKVWRAITDPANFSAWFRAEVNGDFVAGQRVDLVSTYPTHKGEKFFFIVERVEPEHTFGWRWHPGAKSGEKDESTSVEFHLTEKDGGTEVTVIESGFERIDVQRRAKAFQGNTEGWNLQMESLREYVSRGA